jgi:hypothetical protein
MNKKSILNILVAMIFVAVAAIIGFLSGQEFASTNQRPGTHQEAVTNTPPPTNLEYKNTDYRFTVTLPLSWQGYTVSIDKWTGDAIGDELGGIPLAEGPVISIHSPQWTGPNSYQDIPIMIFTINQWSDLQNDKIHIGAAPIGPSELGRNDKYVLALPARYNFAFPPGTEEVQAIIDSKPLHTF